MQKHANKQVNKHVNKEASEDRPTLDAVRVDKWLWSARLFKTRQIAIDAINAGRVDVAGERVKPARLLRVGDEIVVRKPPYSFVIAVTGLAEKRGSATVAHTLYEETEASQLDRERLVAERKALPPPTFPGRPTKRDRRALENFLAAQYGRGDEE